VAVEINNGFCAGCYFNNLEGCLCSTLMNCAKADRKDGKNVIFKLVDLREEYNRGYADGHAACAVGEVEL
jgi:hypothetical protein